MPKAKTKRLQGQRSRLFRCRFRLLSKKSETATSEAVTNAVVHAYPQGGGKIEIIGKIDHEENAIIVTVKDFGCGIQDITSALEPFYTTKPDEERSGMGFTIIDTFSDEMNVTSKVGIGTIVTFKKVFSKC